MKGKKQKAKSVLPDNTNKKLFARESGGSKDLKKLNDMRDNIENHKTGETYDKGKDFREEKSTPKEEMKNDFNIHSGIKIENISDFKKFRNLSDT